MSKSPAARRPSASFLGLIFLTIGALLLMLGERPELRPREGGEVSGGARAVAVLGQGSTAIGAALLTYRAAAWARRHGRRGAPVAQDDARIPVADSKGPPSA